MRTTCEPATGTTGHARRGRALAVAGVAGAGVAGAYAWLVRTEHGQDLDDRLATATSSRRRVRRAARRFLHPYRHGPYAVAVATLGGTGLVRRGPVRTACAGAALVGALVQVEQLKAALDRPPLGSSPSLDWSINSYPSGHTAGVAALAAMGVVLAPERAGSLVASGVLGTGLVGAATVAARWHRPSDVVGAALSAVQWGALGLAAAEALDGVAVRRG